MFNIKVTISTGATVCFNVTQLRGYTSSSPGYCHCEECSDGCGVGVGVGVGMGARVGGKRGGGVGLMFEIIAGIIN